MLWKRKQACVITIVIRCIRRHVDDPSVRKRLRGLGKTRWREEQTTTESSRFSPVLLKIEAVIQERNFFYNLKGLLRPFKL